MSGIIIAAIIVGIVGIAIGFFLSIMSKKLAVAVDEKEEKIREILPGNNCGACGYPGCDGAATAIAKNEADASICPVGGEKMLQEIAEIMGTDAASVTRYVAFVKCSGDIEHAKENYEYSGLQSCAAVDVGPAGGSKGCSFGCRGFGDCIDECDFDAIHIVDGIAKVDKEKCVGCKKCIIACPKNLIDLVPYNKKYMVRCNSKDKAKDVISVCSAGCIGCKICEKACPLPETAISVIDNIAKIDYDRCINCGKCAEKCPKKVITFLPNK